MATQEFLSGHSIVLLGLVSGLFLVLVSLLAGSVFIVQQRTVAIIQRLGQFRRTAGPGLHVKLPLLDQVAGRIDLRVQQMDVAIRTKTADNVFVQIVFSVHFFVLPNRVYDAFYRLDDAVRQIRAFLFDVVSAKVPRLNLDELFAKKDEIAQAVHGELTLVMDEFGYGVLHALVTDIDPDARVRESMNEINAAQRMRAVAMERGEAERILTLKHAEADAQSKALQGQGIANQHRAIVAGLEASVGEFRRAVGGGSARDVMNLMLLTQYFDLLKEMGVSAGSGAVLIPRAPGIMASLTDQIRSACWSPSRASRQQRRRARQASPLQIRLTSAEGEPPKRGNGVPSKH